MDDELPDGWSVDAKPWAWSVSNKKITVMDGADGDLEIEIDDGLYGSRTVFIPAAVLHRALTLLIAPPTPEDQTP